MRVSALPVLVLLLGVSACQVRNSPVLERAQLYNIDSIRAAMAVAGGDSTHWVGYREAAVHAAGIGTNAADTTRSWEAAAGTLKNIICRAPSAGAYFELGEVLLKGQQYVEAIRALQVAEQLHYTPLPEVLCRLSEACSNASALGPGGDSSARLDSAAIHYMQAAIIMGCPRPERFLRDSVFSVLRDLPGFHVLYSFALAGTGDPETMRWREFKGSFPTASLPLVIDTLWLENHGGFQRIDEDFVDFVPAIRTRRFSRSVDEFFSYVANLGSSDSYTLMMYADYFANEARLVAPQGATNLGGRVLRFSRVFYLVSYAPGGKIIDLMPVAGHMGWRDPLKIFAMTTPGRFSVADQTFQYPRNYDSYHYLDNPSSSKVDNLQYFRITPEGRFERTSEALTDRIAPNPAPSGSAQSLSRSTQAPPP